MRNRVLICWQASGFLLVSVVLILALSALTESLGQSLEGQGQGKKHMPTTHRLNGSMGMANLQTSSSQPKVPGMGRQKKEPGKQKPKESEPTSKEPNNNHPISPEEKKLRAISLVEDALAAANGISSIECKVLSQIEGAALLWPSDQTRARSIFQDAVNTARLFLEEENKTKEYKKPRAFRVYETRERRSGLLWIMVLQKIAAVSPTLLQELTADDTKTVKTKNAISGEWTEEARAIINEAYNQIENNPSLAARLAEQSLARGMVDWSEFLRTLSQRDANEAEQLGILLIDRLTGSSISAIVLSNLKSFFLAPGRSANVKEHFLEALLFRLHRDVNPNISRIELEDDLNIAQNMTSIAARVSPQWSLEFERLALEFRKLFESLALPLPEPPKTITIDMQQTTAVPGNTNQIKDALTPVDKIDDVEVRDQKYQKLAVEAALKADLKLAEDMLWRISNEELRRKTTVEVYGPLVRKALGATDWAEAQRLALKVSDPLGRTLMLDQLAQNMLEAKQKKAVILEVYREAASSLEQDAPTSNVAKAWLLLLRSVFMLSPEGGFDPSSSVITSLNKLVSTGELYREDTFSQSLSNWVKLKNRAVNAGEALYLPELLSKAFREMARHDEDRALTLATELVPVLRPLAQIAVSREMLEKAKSEAKSVPTADSLKK